MLIESMNMNSNSMFTCISTSGIALFLSGQIVVSAQRHVCRADSHLRAGQPSVRQLCRVIEPAHFYPDRR